MRTDPKKFLIESKGVILAAPSLHNEGRDLRINVPASNNVVHYACKHGHLGIVKAVVAELERYFAEKDAKKDGEDSRDGPPSSSHLSRALRAYLSVPVWSATRICCCGVPAFLHIRTQLPWRP